MKDKRERAYQVVSRTDQDIYIVETGRTVNMIERIDLEKILEGIERKGSSVEMNQWMKGVTKTVMSLIGRDGVLNRERSGKSMP